MALEGQELTKGKLVEAWDAVNTGPLTGVSYEAGTHGLNPNSKTNGQLNADVSGKSIDVFDESLHKLKEKEREVKEKDFNYGQGGKEIGRIHTLNFLADKNPENSRKKEEKRSRDYRWKETMRLALVDARKMADTFRRLWEEAKEKLALMEAELESLIEEHQHIDELKSEFERNGKFELNEHGELKKPEHESLIQKYEKAHKTKIDRHDSDAVYAILVEMDKTNNLQQQQRKSGIDEQRQVVKERKEDSDNANKVVEDLESDDPERQSEALKKLDEMNKSSQIKTILETDLNSLEASDKNEIAAIKGITEEQLDKYTSFSFGAPNITPGFNSAAQGNTEQPQNENVLYADAKPTQIKPNGP